MSETTYYEFNKPDGTDLVNPLVDTNPNWDIADQALHNLSINSIGTAVEVITGTVHALTRVNQTDSKFIQFIASGDYDEGDTFTLDGIAINAILPDGSTLPSDAYATGVTVLIGLNSDNSTATFYLSAAGGIAPDSERLGGELPPYYASKTYADSIKSTADAAASSIAKKALVNVYADSSNRLYKVLSDGSQGGEILPNWVTLWTNSSPTSNFNPQTISLSLSGYRFIFVDCIYQTTSPSQKTGAMLPNIDGCGVCVLAGVASAVRGRFIKITSSGVEFEAGKSGDSTGNNQVIPQHIYGIR